MTDSPAFSFPDESRSELDRVLEDLMARARHVQLTQGRLRALLKANSLVVEHLDLPVLLSRIVDAAVELVGAKYGALGVLSARRDLQQFIHTGLTDAEVKAIGQLPQGRGLLGALISEPVVIRLDDVAEDPRYAGFPAGHPPMDSFLGVPVRVRDEVYGNLYLCNQDTGQFSHEDEQLVTALAATAGIAIENARLYAETKKRQAWSAASAEITAAMLSVAEGNAIEVLVDRVHTLAEAAVVCVLLPTRKLSRLFVLAGRGLGEVNSAKQLTANRDSAVHAVIEGEQPRLFDSGEDIGVILSADGAMGSTMLVPLVTAGRATGVLLVARRIGTPPYASADLGMAADFAGQASLAMELYTARADQERMSLLEERGRIARDLHDHVIQQLFATGLELSSISRTLPTNAATERIEGSISHLDSSIAQIRTIIFALNGAGRDSTRLAVIDLVNELAASFLVTPTVTFEGPIDLTITEDLAGDVIAVARECLTNAAKHAAAEHISLTLSIADGQVVVEVIDDGVGIPAGVARSGLANLMQRATQRGGSFFVHSRAPGTHVTWSVPSLLADSDGSR